MNKNVALDKNGNYEGHAFNLAMLKAKLSGNHIKVLLAYMNVGGFNPKDAVFLARKDYERFGFVRQTLSTLRKELVEAGWLVYADKKSFEDYEFYYVKVGGPVAKRDRGRRNSRQEVSANATPGVLIHDRELTTELTTEVSNELINNTTPESAEASSGSASKDALPLDKNETHKNDQGSGGALRRDHILPYSSDSVKDFPIDQIIDVEVPVPPMETRATRGVSQNTTPSDTTEEGSVMVAEAPVDNPYVDQGTAFDDVRFEAFKRREKREQERRARLIAQGLCPQCANDPESCFCW